MGTLGRKLVVALVAGGAGCLAGFSSGAAEGKRPIVQTIAASQPPRMKLAVFHPDANASAERSASIAEPTLDKAPEIALQSDSSQLVRTAPVTRGALAVRSGLDLVDPWRANRGRAAPSRKPGERSAKRVSARFDHAEIIDPWSTKR